MTATKNKPAGQVRISINGALFDTLEGKNSVQHLKELANIPPEDILSEIKNGNPHDLKDNASVQIKGGEIFTSRKIQPELVEIEINGVKRQTAPGKNTVAHLRDIGQVPADEILAEWRGGKFVDLADDGHVEIRGGEKFASHIKSSGSS